MTASRDALTQGYIREHDQLGAGLAALTEVLDRLIQDVDPAAVRALAQSRRFLRDVFVPHAEWEELTFYPALADLVRTHGDPNAAMYIDHREILRRIEAFAALAARIEAGERDPALIDRARILAYQIQALVDAHEKKEEEIHLALMRRHLSDREQVRALSLGDQLGHD
ncbi:MAG: hemerythrin domain-containing protein [Armatimonadota bacterium]|nr:hemerythrin domain-containing protein [Armatimonadota bacterium]MDR7422289.1 hemerythrin domain-containing protein [Armatimonadota bacterium]MDR7453759.1 hemerythrin domain-containing protein [Armatimonadota bacterium]MDR7456288.1 hemerythrin domain-containing protein [Armatimonadota bacterium]MDR7496285.1 hemerythrin domain-containing protein [Armatimonadota bacterium]